METLSWPVVLKPAVSRNYLPDEGTIETCSVCYANDFETLAERMQEFEGRHKILLQTYCPGVGHGVELLAAAVGLLGTKLDIGFSGDPKPGFGEISKIARKFTGKLAARSAHPD